MPSGAIDSSTRFSGVGTESGGSFDDVEGSPGLKPDPEDVDSVEASPLLGGSTPVAKRDPITTAHTNTALPPKIAVDRLISHLLNQPRQNPGWQYPISFDLGARTVL